MPLFALFIVACASALSALCATAQPRSPLSPSEQATERALDAFLTQPRYRDPDEGERRFSTLLTLAQARLGSVQAGRYGAHMRVSLVNDGPVTFWLQVPPAA